MRDSHKPAFGRVLELSVASDTRNKKPSVIREKGTENHGAYVPDLPGCVAVGDTVEEVLDLIKEAVALHVKGLVEDGDPIPPATTISREVQAEVAV